MKFKIGFSILFVSVILGSGCVSLNDSTNADTPDKAVETYFNKINGFYKDYKSSYEMLSIEVRHHGSYEDYKRIMNNYEESNPGANYKLINTKIVEQREDYAAVNVTIEAKTPRKQINSTRKIDLYKEEGEWKLIQRFHPRAPS